MTRYEQETVINYNQEEAQVYTCNAFPKKWIKVKPLRQLSDEKRSELAERAKRNFGKNGENE